MNFENNLKKIKSEEDFLKDNGTFYNIYCVKLNFLEKLIENNSKNSSFIENKNEISNIEKLRESSYLELTPDYIENNFNSNPKSHWQPPKPVLLENFENNIGSQLKEISQLARYNFILYLTIIVI